MPNTNDASGAPHAWDDGWVFHHGSHVSDSGEYDGKYSDWEFTSKRDSDYGYASNGAHTDVVLGSVDILHHFRHGLNASKSGDAAQMVNARNNIYRILALSSIRAALKYAYKAQHPYSDEYLMEAYVYFLCAAGWVEQASSDVGKNVLALLDYKHNSTQLTPDLYCAVKAALIPAYEALGLDCQKVGTWKELPSGKTCNVTCPTVQDDLPTGLQSYVPDTDTSAGNNVDCHPDYQLSSTETESSAALGASGISLAAVLCTILRYS